MGTSWRDALGKSLTSLNHCILNHKRNVVPDSEGNCRDQPAWVSRSQLRAPRHSRAVTVCGHGHVIACACLRGLASVTACSRVQWK